VVMPPESTDFGESVDVIREGKAYEARIGERIPVQGSSRLKVKRRES